MQLNFCMSCTWQVVQTHTLPAAQQSQSKSGRMWEIITVREPQEQQKLTECGSRDGLIEDQKIHLFFFSIENRFLFIKEHDWHTNSERMDVCIHSSSANKTVLQLNFYCFCSACAVAKKKNWNIRGSQGIKYELSLYEGIVKILPSVKGWGLIFLPSAIQWNCTDANLIKSKG